MGNVMSGNKIPLTGPNPWAWHEDSMPRRAWRYDDSIGEAPLSNDQLRWDVSVDEDGYGVVSYSTNGIFNAFCLPYKHGRNLPEVRISSTPAHGTVILTGPLNGCGLTRRREGAFDWWAHNNNCRQKSIVSNSIPPILVTPEHYLLDEYYMRISGRNKIPQNHMFLTYSIVKRAWIAFKWTYVFGANNANPRVCDDVMPANGEPWILR